MCGVCDIDAKGSGNDCRDLEVSCTIPKPLTVLVHQDKDYWLKNEPLDWKWNQLERECNAIIVLPESVGELRLDQPMGNDDIVIYATYEPSQKHHDSARNLHNKPYWWPCTIKMTYQCVECDINLKNSVDDCSGTRWGKYNFWLQNFWLHSRETKLDGQRHQSKHARLLHLKNLKDQGHNKNIQLFVLLKLAWEAYSVPTKMLWGQALCHGVWKSQWVIHLWWWWDTPTKLP